MRRGRRQRRLPGTSKDRRGSKVVEVRLESARRRSLRLSSTPAGASWRGCRVSSAVQLGPLAEDVPRHPAHDDLPRADHDQRRAAQDQVDALDAGAVGLNRLGRVAVNECGTRARVGLFERLDPLKQERIAGLRMAWPWSALP